MLRGDTAAHSVPRVRELSRRQLLGYVAIGVVVVVLGAWWVRDGQRGGAAPAEDRGGGVAGAADGGAGGVAVSEAGGGTVVVHVAGAVREPGLYRLRDGARVAAAIRRAGGPTRRANLDALNLAARLSDGRQVLVPERPRAGAAAVAGGGDATAAGGPVNLNSATVEELDQLDGIGPITAQKIVDHREAHGGFASVDDLDAVPGIGPATIEALRDQVTV